MIIDRQKVPRKALSALSMLALITALAGCSSASNTPDSGMPNVSAPSDGSIQGASPDLTPPPPTLSEIEGVTPPDAGPNAKEQARIASVKEAGLTYGFQGGLAYGTHLINQEVRAQSDYLTKTFDFSPLLIDAPYGTKILPPVIVASVNIYDQVDPNTVVIADKRYHILEPAAFAPVQPLWQTYLIMPWTPAVEPTAKDLPDTEIEHKVWDLAVRKGWVAGEAQALDIFKINDARLERSFIGMVRWNRLVATGRVTTPVIDATMRPVVGDDLTVTINKGEVKISEPARLQVYPGAH